MKKTLVITKELEGYVTVECPDETTDEQLEAWALSHAAMLDGYLDQNGQWDDYGDSAEILIDDSVDADEADFILEGD